jgi:hypothetical protein
MFWLRRFLSPLFLVLVLTCLAFPFVGMSCGPIDVEISGWDMAAGGEPSVSSPDPSVEEQLSEVAGEGSIPAQPLMIMFVLSLLIAATLGITLGSALARALTRLTATGFAAVTLFANQLVVMGNLVDQLAGPSRQAHQQAAELVNPGFGFWLTLALTITVFGCNVAELALSRRQHGTAQPIPPGGYVTGSSWASSWTSPWALHQWPITPPNTDRDDYW